jgi:hypothetical protein
MSCPAGFLKEKVATQSASTLDIAYLSVEEAEDVTPPRNPRRQ